MRLLKHLNEAYIPDIYDLGDEEISTIIKRDCQPILKIMKQTKKPLLRGSHKLSGSRFIDKFKVRTDRKPRDMDTQSQKYMDKVFFKQFGWKPRQEGLFCVSDVKTATFYGDADIVLPIGKFEYLWSPKVADLYNDKKYPSGIKAEIKELIQAFFLKDPTMNDIAKDIVDNYKNTNIEQAMTNYPRHEIMIKCKEYYLVDISMFVNRLTRLL